MYEETMRCYGKMVHESLGVSRTDFCIFSRFGNSKGTVREKRSLFHAVSSSLIVFEATSENLQSSWFPCNSEAVCWFWWVLYVSEGPIAQSLCYVSPVSSHNLFYFNWEIYVMILVTKRVTPSVQTPLVLPGYECRIKFHTCTIIFKPIFSDIRVVYFMNITF